jgi:hypothetical protein
MMRPIHPYRLLSLVVLAGALALSGCAQGGSGAAAPGPDQPTTPAAASSASTAGVPASVFCPDGVLQTETVVLKDQDNGRTVCVSAGTHVEIYLQGTATDRWSNPVPDSDVLRPEPSGKGALMVGVSAGFYVANHRGTAVVTATRDNAHFELHVSVL